jgi:hypothetical protein
MNEKKATEDLLVAEQMALADGVRASLRRVGAAFAESATATSHEAFVVFDIQPRPGARHLHVKVAVLGDQFNVTVNEAFCFVPLRAFARGRDVSGWIADSVTRLTALLANDLRIRIRTTLFGGEAGAIWWPNGSDGNGGWGGDAAACRGNGTEVVFPHPWYAVIERHGQ